MQNTQSQDDIVFSLGEGMDAEKVYNKLATTRDAVLQTARELAEITIPSVFPPMGYVEGQYIGENNQSVGAWCVNTLASKLMYVAFPPNHSSIKISLDKAAIRNSKEAFAQDPVMVAKIDGSLSALEKEHHDRFAATKLRLAYTQYIKQLLIGGNSCWEHEELDSPVVHDMTKYVVKRDKKGNQQFVILREEASSSDLPAHMKVIAANVNREQWLNKDRWEQDIVIHKVCMRYNKDEWLTWQEYQGEVIPDTELHIKEDKPNLYAGWMVPMQGYNWGRSYCEEYRGDLWQVENYSSGLQDIGAAMAFTIMFSRPGSPTSPALLSRTENLKWLAGSADDLSVLQLDKGREAAFISNEIQEATRRLARAFLTMSSIQRNAERVTAEELRMMAQELDEAMGGLHANLAQTSQKAIMLRAVALHEAENPNLPQLPKGLTKMRVITGVDALGRSAEGQSLVRAAGTVRDVFGQEGLKRIDADEFTRRVFASESVDPTGLILAVDQVQQNDQAAQQAAMMQSSAPGVAKEAAKAAMGGAASVIVPQLQHQIGQGQQAQGQPPTTQQ
jgi:hypothetical protein